MGSRLGRGWRDRSGEGCALGDGQGSRSPGPAGAGPACRGGAAEAEPQPSPALETLTPDIEVVVFLRAARLVQRLTGVAACVPHLRSVHLAEGTWPISGGSTEMGHPGQTPCLSLPIWNLGVTTAPPAPPAP